MRKEILKSATFATHFEDRLGQNALGMDRRALIPSTYLISACLKKPMVASLESSQKFSSAKFKGS